MLAERLGVGARHLRRLFGEHLGASPLGIARARRIDVARRLIDESGLPMTSVAFASGFRSVRQFNHSIRTVFGQTPRELRRRRPSDEPTGDGRVRLTLPYRPPGLSRALLIFSERRLQVRS